MPEGLTQDNTLVIIGDKDAVLGFRALGFKVYALSEAEEFEKVLDGLVSSNAGICLVQENLYRKHLELINSYRKLTLPIFIPFAKDAKMDLLEEIVKDIRIRATGAL